MNKVEIIGRLTKEPEVKLTQNETPFCSFTVAVDRRYKDASGQRQTDFINCVAWKQTAQFIQKYFHKGNRIGICGSIQTRSYEKDGQKTFITEVLVEETEFVESNKAETTPETSPEPVATSEPEKTPAPETNQGSGELPFEI